METEEKKVYTIDDIARELGVSKTTVSRTISGKGRIGQATRERVLEFIEKHDYRPNVMAKGLAQKSLWFPSQSLLYLSGIQRKSTYD